MPSWLSSATSHPRSREHHWAKGLQAPWVAGGLSYSNKSIEHVGVTLGRALALTCPGVQPGSVLPNGIAHFCIPTELSLLRVRPELDLWALHIRSEYNSSCGYLLSEKQDGWCFPSLAKVNWGSESITFHLLLSLPFAPCTLTQKSIWQEQLRFLAFILQL